MDYFASWSKRLWCSIRPGGFWGIPRSGVLFRITATGMELHDLMPWDSRMPMTATELREQQRGEYEAVKKHFGSAGLKVTDPKHLLTD